jgi:hypothetical protein
MAAILFPYATKLLHQARLHGDSSGARRQVGISEAFGRRSSWVHEGYQLIYLGVVISDGNRRNVRQRIVVEKKAWRYLREPSMRYNKQDVGARVDDARLWKRG